MSEPINFNKTVFIKSQYEKIINTQFTQLGTTNIQEQINSQPTIEEFFSLYNTLFYDIPETGDINSHEYLIKQSTDYIKYDGINDEILALQAEISQLREELLDTQKQLFNLSQPNP
jgi:hypothetical protein